MKKSSLLFRYSIQAFLLLVAFHAQPALAGLTASPTPNGDGNYTVSWTTSALPFITDYKLMESSDGGSTWTQRYIGTGLTQSFSNRTVNTYDYAIKECWWDYTFGPLFVCVDPGYPNVQVVVDDGSPPVPDNVTGHDFDFDASYTVSWDAATGADSYDVEEKIGTGNWATVTDPNDTDTSVSITATVSDTHYYRVKACNTSGCSLWSITHQTVVDLLDNIAAETAFGSSSAAGSTEVFASVNRLGNATISVPLTLPPGVNGMAPNLSISYSSGGAPALADDKRSVGTLGYGWGVSGIPAITRCRVGIGGSIEFNVNDKLCFGDQALVAVGTPGYWFLTAEYRTESQSFLKIQTKGTSNNNFYFEIKTPDGKTMTFGDTDESRLVSESLEYRPYQWSLTKVVDEYGNEVTYTWDESSALGTNILTDIAYDGTTVEFFYDERCASSANCDTEHVQHGENVPGIQYRGVVLNRVRTQVNGNQVSDYRLDNNYASGYLRLDGIQHCAYDESGSNVKCMTPLSFTWDILNITDGTETKDLNTVTKVTNGFGDETQFSYAVIDGSGTSNHALHVDAPSWFGSYTQPSLLTEKSTMQRAVVDWVSRPNGAGGSTLTYHSYNGYPLYSVAGRGFVGFPNTRSELLSRKLYDPSSQTSFDSTLRTDRQHRLDFPFIGKTSRVIRSIDTDSSSGEAWREPARFEYGWALKPMFSSTVYFVHLARSYSRINELDASGAHQTLRATESEDIYCFRTLVSGDCPTTGTEYEYPTRVTNTTRTGDGLGSQDFGSTWGVVGDRTVTNQMRIDESTADFENDVAGSNWLIGFLTDLERGYGQTSISLTEEMEFTKDSAASLDIGQVIRFPNDANHQLTSTFDFDDDGNLSSATTSGINVASRTTSASSFLDNRYPQTITNALGQNTLVVYDKRFGAPKKVTDPNGRFVTVVLDEFGRTESVEQPDGSKATISYTDCSSGCSAITWATPRLRVEQTFNNGVTQIAPKQISYYDAAGNLVLIESEAFSSADGNIRREFVYDDVGQLIKESLPYHSVGGTPKYVEHHFDFKGRSVHDKLPDLTGAKTTFVGSTGQVVIEVEEPGTGVKKQSKFNEISQMTETTDAYGTVDAVRTDYTYTVRGNLDTVKVDNVQVADIDYYASGMRSSINEPNTGLTSYLSDALGLTLQVTDAAQNKSRYTFDKLGRLTQRIDGYQASGSMTNSWTWDTATNGVGLLKSRQSPGFTEAYAYTSSGQLDKITAAINITGFNDNGNYIVDFSYDSSGRVSTTAYPNITATLDYNGRGYLSKIKDGSTVLQEFEDIDAFGNVLAESFENGIKTARQYDPNTGRLTSIETGLATAPKAVQDLLYAWRANGTLLSRKDERGTGTGSDDYVETFDYDAMNRMEKSTTSNWNRILDNSFDDFGNLESKTSNVTGDTDVTGFTYGASGKPHRLTSVSIDNVSNTISYDSKGSITRYDAASGDDTFIDYSVANRVIEITVGDSATDATPTARDEFWYGPNGQRFLRKATWMNGSALETSWTLYLMGGGFEEVHPEYDSGVDYVQRVQLSTSVQHRYVQAPTSSAEHIDYLHRDHLGSIDVITGANGTVLRNLSFDAFGSRRENDWSSDASSTTEAVAASDADSITGRGYTGHEHLSRTGFIHMNGRVFDPRSGRFLRADPIVQSPSFSSSYNRYSYTSNNPLSAIDPTGFQEEDDSEDKEDEEEPIEEIVSTSYRFVNRSGAFASGFWVPNGAWYGSYIALSGGWAASRGSRSEGNLAVVELSDRGDIGECLKDDVFSADGSAGIQAGFELGAKGLLSFNADVTILAGGGPLSGLLSGDVQQLPQHAGLSLDIPGITLLEAGLGREFGPDWPTPYGDTFIRRDELILQFAAKMGFGIDLQYNVTRGIKRTVCLNKIRGDPYPVFD